MAPLAVIILLSLLLALPSDGVVARPLITLEHGLFDQVKNTNPPVEGWPSGFL
jgi:hypothetical protein